MFKIIFTSATETLLLGTCKSTDISKKIEMFKLLYTVSRVVVDSDRKIISLEG